VSDITDHPPFGAPRRPQIVRRADERGVPARVEPMFEAHADALTDALRRASQSPPAPADMAAELTYLESIAKRLLWLPYGDMKQLAAEAMGDQECKTAADFADRLHAWAEKVEAKALGKGETA